MTLRALILLAIAAPIIGQNEAEPYFSLSSNRTFASQGKPAVGFSAFNVTSLEFRVYRVNDPLKFFGQLEDVHRFGGRAPKPPTEKTLLERLHEWKREKHADIRRSMRAQFTEPPSSHFEKLLPAESQPTPTKGTQYAEAPVLNSQQLVLTFTQQVRSRSRWETQNVPINVPDKGVFLVEAVHKDLRAYTILIVSDVVMLTKTGRGRVLTWLTERGSGNPIAGAEISMFGHDAKADRESPIATVKTDADGLAEFTPPAGVSHDVRLLARHEGNAAIATVSPYSLNGGRDDWTGYIYTDRPVYRPSHPMHFKGILRTRASGGYEVPAGKQITMEIRDPNQKVIYQKTLTTSASGSIRDDLTLPADAALGNYYIEARSGEAYMSGNFEVQEYKKPEYEVRVTAAKTRVLQGDPVQALIDARYYFGEPVNAGKVKWTVYRSRYWFPLWYDPDDDSVGDGSDSGGEPNDMFDENDQIAEGEGVLDADGKLNITVPNEVSEHHADYRYRIEARVTDDAKREISGTGWVIATYGSYLLNVEPDRYMYQAGSKATFTVEARDYDTKFVAAKVHVELLHYKRGQKEPEILSATDVNTSATEAAKVDMQIPARGGSHRVRVTSRTPEGRTVEQSTYLWISGRDEADRYGAGRKTVQIIADKKTYRPGDTAKLLIMTGQPNTAVLVSIEGRDLRLRKVLRSSEASVVFEVPIAASDEPGLFVTAQFIRNGELYQSMKRLRVPPEERKLNVKLSTDKPQYLPGQTAIYSVDATDSAGKPVPRAEFSLGVVDEAIYAIQRDTTPDMLGFFYGRDYNSVYTVSSLEFYFSGEAGKRRMRLASLRTPSRLAQLKPDRIVKPKVRKLFPDTAFWNPEVVTDAGGHATAKVAFPDSLTTWRATVRGISADSKVGSATLKTIVRKNLILRLAVPRFFVQGDEVVISAIVHNYLAAEKTARISLDLTGLDVLDGKTQDVKIPSRGEVKVDWRVRAQRTRKATVHGEALTNEESDALELELPVNPAGVKMAQRKGGSLSNTASAAFVLTYPPQVEPGSRSLTIHVSHSIAGSLFSALNYLITFPYGCVEQTMSSFLPNIIVKKAMGELGLKTNIDQAALQEKIHAGLDRLYSFQHEDGGWGWWETDESHPFMTAYVVSGLVQARSAGTAVNEEAIQKGAAWLEKNGNAKYAADLRAYMAYALSLAGRTSRPPELSKLSAYGLALVGQMPDQAAQKDAIVALLEKQVKQSSEEAWWPSTRDEMLDFDSDATPEATAFALKFLTNARPDSPLLPKAALWLMNHRNEGYWWSTTKQTAMVIYGLTDYLKATKELNPNLTATVTVNDQPALAAIDGDITLDETKLRPGANQIRIATTGAGRLYYSTRAEYFSTEKKLQANGSVSLNILRDYFRLVPAKDGDRIVYDTTPFTGPAASGDIIAVRLTVTGSDWKYLLVEDPIPAGTEFIEKDQLYQLKNKPPWWAYYFNRREMHDDRMAIFQTYFTRGQQQYFYLLKVVNPGLFQVSPARVQPMYQPDFMATTESMRLEVK